jgi:glycosyltransferase involved in cell wall biosynthesis
MLGLDGDCFVMGFAGSVEQWYALDEVVRTFPEIVKYRDNARLLIVGGSLFTDYETQLKNLVRELGIEDKVIFAGLVEYKELPKYISAMELCLIPPCLWQDIGLPNKFFEYSACAKPILSAPIPDMMKISGENLFIYKDKEEFIEKARYIMDNPRTYIIDMEQYSWQGKAKEFEELLEELIQKVRK